jgi:hypothetical protein
VSRRVLGRRKWADDRSWDKGRDKGRIERFDHAVPIVSRSAQGAGREDWLAVD